MMIVAWMAASPRRMRLPRQRPARRWPRVSGPRAGEIVLPHHPFLGVLVDGVFARIDFIAVDEVVQLKGLTENDGLSIGAFDGGGLAAQPADEDREMPHARTGLRPDGDAVLRLGLAESNFPADHRRGGQKFVPLVL